VLEEAYVRSKMADKETDTTRSGRRADRDSGRSQEIGRLPAPQPLRPRQAPDPGEVASKPPARNLDHFRFDKKSSLKPWLKGEEFAKDRRRNPTAIVKQDSQPARPTKSAAALDENEMSLVVRKRAQQLARFAGRAGMDLGSAQVSGP
jgi:hypothetical protein